MTVGANSYGTAADVAALAAMYTDSMTHLFTATTLPTITQVEGFIDQVSGMMNAALAKAGFRIPITQADAVLSVKLMVVQLAADLALGVRTSGRFYSKKVLEGGFSPINIIRTEIAGWVESQASGLESLGAFRVQPNLAQVATRQYDNSGKQITPIFQRSGFGNVFENWDDGNQ